MHIHTHTYCGVYLLFLASLQPAESCAYIPAVAFTCTVFTSRCIFLLLLIFFSFSFSFPLLQSYHQGILRSALTHTSASYACKSPQKPVFLNFHCNTQHSCLCKCKFDNTSGLGLYYHLLLLCEQCLQMTPPFFAMNTTQQNSTSLTP